jgi:putative nucleotidyltransferase with HDIG domain
MMVPDALYEQLLGERMVADHLAALRDHHEETFDHSLSVARLSLAFGYSLGIDDAQLTALGYGAFLHDVGKLSVPARILAKRDPLSDEERLIIREHPRIGFELIGTADKTVRSLVVAHHECKNDPYPRARQQPFDGPERRKPKDTRLIQILSLADMYVALSENRSYHEGLDPMLARTTLESEYRGDHRYLDSLVQNMRVTNSVVTPARSPTPA